MPTELNLSEPSAWESFLKTIGLGGYAVRNLLQGNVEGAGANVVDLLSSPIRAILPGDQSNWEASRKQDLPEFSDVMQSWGADKMDPGLLKTGVDIVGSIATDPLTYLPGGILLKGAKGATAGARSALRAVSPTADMLLTKGLHNVRSVAGALKPAEAVAEDIAKGQGAAAIVRNPLQEAAIADFGKFDPRVSEAIANAMEAVKGTPGKMVPHGTPFPEAFGTRASKVSYLENQLRTMGLDPAVEAKALEVAPKVVDLSDVTYREAIERGTMYRPEVYTDEAGDIIPAAPLHQVFEESDKAIAKELRFHKNEIARYNQRTAAGEAKVSQLAPVEESLLARYAAASEKSDDLLDKLPDLRTRKRAFDALDEKVASRQAAADVIGRMESRSGTRQVNLQNQLNSANDAIKQHRDALAALKAATITATEPEILETLKLNAKIAAAESSLRMGELVSMAKQGAFGELPVAYDAMKLARKQASAARKEYDAARAAGVDAQEVARLRDIKDSLMEAAEVAQKSLRRINTRLSESGGYDKAISGSAVREGGKLRELRALMQQLDDPDLAHTRHMRSGPRQDRERMGETRRRNDDQ